MLVLVVALGALVGVLKLHRHKLEKQLAAELQAIHARGEPLSMEELDAWIPDVPASSNAAPLVLEAMKRLHYEHMLEAKEYRPGAGTNSAGRALAEAFVATNRASIDLLLKTIDCPNGRYAFYDAYKSNPDRSDFKRFAVVRNAVDLLWIDWMLQLEDGDSRSAAKAILAAMSTANSLKAEPLFLSRLIHIDCWGIITYQSDSWLGTGDFTDQELAHMGQLASVAETACTNFSGAMMGERVSLLKGFKQFTGKAWTRDPFDYWTPSASNSFAEMWRPKALYWRGSYLLYKAFATDVEEQLLFIRSVDGFIRICNLPTQERTVAMSNAVWRATETAAERNLGFFYDLLPTFQTLVQRELRHLASLRCLRMALVIERYRLAHAGRLPGNLDELSDFFPKGAPADPFTGNALHYLREGNSYRVYSLGEDGRDDQGDRKRDVAIRVVRP